MIMCQGSKAKTLEEIYTEEYKYLSWNRMMILLSLTSVGDRDAKEHD